MSTSEPLFDCPKCGRTNFTAKGLKAHACKAAKTAIVKAPALKSGRDSKAVAKQLDALITDAESGLRRIVTAGLFIVEITQDLPHGQFGPWMKAHLPQRSPSTIWNWKALALNVIESCGLKLQQLEFSTPLHKVMALPAAKVPKDAKEVRQKIDELIDGKTYRQLFFEFKQAEEQTDEDGETVVVPTHGGDVTPRGADGKRVSKRRRTVKEITAETFEAESKVALEAITKAFDALFTITGPKGEKAWDTLDHEALAALKMQASDLYNATKATEDRRLNKKLVIALPADTQRKAFKDKA